MASILILCARF